VNLFWALDKMRQQFDLSAEDPIPGLTKMAEQIHADDLAANLAMGERGADILGDAKAV
jgi:methylthioribose-1-phosphate isomerase